MGPAWSYHTSIWFPPLSQEMNFHPHRLKATLEPYCFQPKILKLLHWKSFKVQFIMRMFPTHPANQAELAAFPSGREPLQWDSARLTVTTVPQEPTGRFLLCAQARCLHGMRICQMHLSTCCRKLGMNYIVNGMGEATGWELCLQLESCF